jgi:hypothetical protein
MPEYIAHLATERTRRALERIARLGKEDRDAVKALPVLVRTQGLIAALDLTTSKLADSVVVHLTETPGPIKGSRTSRSELITAWIRLSPADAAQVEEEAVRFAEDLKMLSKALE